ncbi:MAG: exodeoxyribonuclease III [Hyphomonadaceae bacterium]|nr:exodeoxyribonuclease III [Hyphomonadaceae bacterium]
MLRIATWNINSVRLRIDMVCRFLGDEKPDVLCLQEIKCRNGEFPEKAFKQAGYKHMHVVGQKGWHGVAIVSKLKLEPIEAPALCPKDEARVAAAKVAGIEVHNLYVPAGADVPDPEANPKFAHKLTVLDRMKSAYKKRRGSAPMVLVGDLNVAPGEFDVWSHKQLLNVVSHTPAETERLNAAREAGGFVDLARLHKPDPEKVFTWWSYRSPDWTKNNRGRRLDHIWASADLAPHSQGDLFQIHAPCRSWERPSDHVPVVAGLKL